MSVPLGQPVTFAFNVYSDPAQTTLADPSTVALTITRPDQTTETHAWTGDITRVALGQFSYLLTPTLLGTYRAHWTSTGVVTAFDDLITVRGAASILSVEEVRTHLNFPDTKNDAEVQGFIDAATPIVENIIGPVRPQTFTEWHEGGRSELLLRRRPVMQGTVSVTEYAGTVSYTLTEQSPDTATNLDAFGFFVFYDEGLVQRTAYGVPSWFAAMPWWTTRTPAWYVATPTRVGNGQGRVKVVYTAGRSIIPDDVRLAALELVREMWGASQRGDSSGRPIPGDSIEAAQPAYVSEDVPPLVRRLLAPYRQSRSIL